MHYLRLYADADGESHFEEVDIAFQEVTYAPPAPPLHLSAFMPAAQVGFITMLAGWFGDWHPSPRRQCLALLAGELELEVSDGQCRRWRSGEVLLLEDTTGKGHRSRVVSLELAVLIVAALPAG